MWTRRRSWRRCRPDYVAGTLAKPYGLAPELLNIFLIEPLPVALDRPSVLVCREFLQCHFCQFAVRVHRQGVVQLATSLIRFP